MVCPQCELPAALHQQHWRDTEQKKGLQLLQSIWHMFWNAVKIKRKKKTKQNTVEYLNFCTIQWATILPDNHKFYSDMLFLSPAWGRRAAWKDRKCPGDGTGGCKHIWTFTHHLKRKEILISATWAALTPRLKSHRCPIEKHRKIVILLNQQLCSVAKNDLCPPWRRREKQRKFPQQWEANFYIKSINK